MARSDFNWGADDWELFGPGKLKVYERGGMLYGSVSPLLPAPLSLTTTSKIHASFNSSRV